MKWITAIAVVACLASMSVRADNMSNEYKGCVILLTATNTEGDVDEKYCVRLRQALLGNSDDPEKQFTVCSTIGVYAWTKNIGGNMPRAARKGVLVGCLMMIKGISEKDASQLYETTNPKGKP